MSKLRVLRPVKRLHELSIWAPGAVPVEEGKTARDMKRVIFPLLDVCLIAMGVLGSVHVVPALNETLPDDAVDGICAAFAFFALLALIGVAFPRLAFLEFFAKSVLAAALAGFMAALVFVAVGATGTVGNNSRWYVLPVFAFLFSLVLWRALQLSTEWGRRQAVSRRRRRGVVT